MATEKLLQTRIQLKYDSFAEWSAHSDVVLKKGEIGICAIPSGSSAMNGDGARPQILFKVGDGETTFAKLPWASAKAADVYDWAKAASLPVTKNGSGNVVSNIYWDDSTGGIKFDTASVATSTELETVSTNLTNLTNKVNAMYTNEQIDTKVSGVQTYAEGVNEALASYKASNNGRVKAVEDSVAAINHETTGILAQAKSYTDGKDSAMNSRVQVLEAIKHEEFAKSADVAATYETIENISAYKTTVNGTLASHSTDIEANATAIAAINNESTGILKQAKDYADGKETSLGSRIDNLSNDVVHNDTFSAFQTTNTAAIKKAADDAEKNAKDYADEIKNDLLGNSEELVGTYDTLKEIAGWIATHGEQAADLAGDLAEESKTRGEEISRVEDLISGEATRAKGVEQNLAADIAKIANGTTEVAKAAEAVKATQDGNGKVIADTYESKTDAANKLTEAKGYTDAEIVKAKSYADEKVSALSTTLTGANTALGNRLTAVEGYFTDGKANEAAKVSHSLTVTMEDGSTKTFDGSADVAVDLSNLATDTQVATAAADALSEAKSHTNTAIAGEKKAREDADAALDGRVKTLEDNHVSTITGATGLKTTKTANAYEIAFDDAVVFVFDCGSASKLVD